MSSIPIFDYFPSDDQIPGMGTFGGDPWRHNSSGWRSRSGPQKPLGPKDMNYDEIKAKYLMENRLFEDPDFPINDSVLYYYKYKPQNSYKWKRPKEIRENPEFFVEGASRFDVKQHRLGDCWMLAAMSCMSMHPDLRKKVVPDGQSFKDGQYAGIFRFNLWSFGEWVPVIIDDRLPTDNNRLVYTCSSQQNEFWTALLEKAYAKLYGSYSAIHGGRPIEAMEDFTGGIGEAYELRPIAPSNLWNIMVKADERKSLMCCATDKQNTNGLATGHAYSVTRVMPLKTQALGNLQMVRVRNPWGEDDKEWKGVWRDEAPIWDQLSKSEKEKLGCKDDKQDGEFWMIYKEFVESFEELHVCLLDPKCFTDNAVILKEKHWETKCHKGCWKQGISAGGYVSSRNFCTNPQYGFEVVVVDEGDCKGTGTTIIALIQRDRNRKDVNNPEIGYAIYKLENPLSADYAPLDEKFNFNNFINKRPLEISNEREICGRHELPPGSYCVVPFTKNTINDADFLLRIFTEKPVNSKELDEPTAIMDPSRSEVKPASEDLKKCKKMWDGFQTNSWKSQRIDAWDLQKILNAEFMKEFKFEGLSAETCWSLVALKQVGRSSMLGYREFVELWILLQKWKAAFMSYAKDGNGAFYSYELRPAMHDIGYSVSNQTFSALVMACSHNDSKLYLDDFIHGMASLMTMLVYPDDHVL